MKLKKKDIALGIGINACRFLLAAAFVFSGFVKAVDPLGFQYKIQDYLEAFGISSWVPSFLPFIASVALPAVEFFVGICLLLGIRRSLASFLVLLFMLVMTPLTLYLAIKNPVSDCGCFGDAWVLTNWETFGKNVVLIVAALVVFIYRKLMWRFFSPNSEWLVSLYTLIFVVSLSMYCLRYLPILDFRPYKLGKNITEGMGIPEGAKLTQYDTFFILEKEGKRQEFNLENYPDSTWTFVDTRTVVKEKGYEPPIHDFNMMEMETGEDITEQVLAYPGYTFLLIAHRVEEADDSNIDLINEIYDYSVEHGYGFYGLTSSPQQSVELWQDKTGAEYPFCQMDDITLKTIIRSNPGLMLIKDGTILNKWSNAELPDEYALSDRLEKLELGKAGQVNDLHTMGYVLLWFVIPLLVVLALDLLVVRRLERKRKRKQQHHQKDTQVDAQLTPGNIRDDQTDAPKNN